VFALLTANIPKSRELDTEQPGPESDQLFDLGSTAATCLPTKDLQLGRSERSANELLGTERTGLNRQSDRPVADQNFTGYALNIVWAKWACPA